MITDSSKILSSCECGTANTVFKNRIIGGVDTSPHEYPWVAAIFDNDDEIYCGGSIISTKHILSAGHCVYYTDPFKLHAILGMHDRIKRDGIRYDFKDIFIHPNFTALQYHDTSDIAIMKTTKPIIFSDVIKPICLPQDDSYWYEDEKATVAGWGRMWSGGDNSRHLQETKVMIQSSDECRKTRIGFLLEPETMICGYAKNADACQGDSGGPLFVESGFNRHEQFGVISFGIGCGTENSPGIYSRLTTFLPWVKRIISDAAVCTDPAFHG